MIFSQKSISVQRINDQILYLNYPSQYHLTSSLIRIEFNGSSNKSNKTRSLEYILDHFIENDKFTYFTDWSAYSLNDYCIKSFYNNFKSVLSKKERILFSLIKEHMPNWENEKFSLVLVCNKNDFNHELAHSFRYLYSDYSNYMKDLVDNLSFKTSLFKKIRKMGYTNDCLYDETQSYLATSSDTDLENRFGIIDKKEIIDQFRRYFHNFKKKVLNEHRQ